MDNGRPGAYFLRGAPLSKPRHHLSRCVSKKMKSRNFELKIIKLWQEL